MDHIRDGHPQLNGINMKKRVTNFLLAALTLSGCAVPEVDLREEQTRSFASIPVRLSLDNPTGTDSTGTRSAIEIDDDDIRKVALFVFDASSGTICLDSSGRPFTTEQTSRSFDWELPCHPDGSPLDVEIYTVCNYGSLSLPLNEKNLKSSTLDGLTYSISGIGELERGMPMAGINRLRLSPSTRSVTLHVKKLFACFFFEFDTKELDAAGLTLQALHLTTHQVNTKVHWFTEGDKAGGTTGLDYASEEDLRYLAEGGDSYVYVLENMQGTIEGAGSWKTVRNDLGAKVSRCTYVDIGIKVLDQEGLYENRTFQVYLGKGDMTSDFNIPRNMLKTIKVRIPAENPDFSWDRKQITLAPGESQEVGYKTTFSLSQLRFSTDGKECTVRSSVLGKAVVSVSDKTKDGDLFLVEGGSSGCTSMLKVIVKEPTVLSCSWPKKVTYVGYRSVFRIDGMQKDEKIATISKTHPKSHIITENDTFVFIPGGEGRETLNVKTTFGRSLTILTGDATLPALSADPSVRLSIDGTPEYPDAWYIDPETDKKLDGFDPDFFNSYLRIGRSTVLPEGNNPANRVKTESTDAGVAVFSYHIEGYTAGEKAATVRLFPIDYEELSADVLAYIKSPGNALENLGELHDYSLIPESGPMSSEETPITSLEGSWQAASLDVDPSSIIYPPDTDGVELEWKTGTVSRFTVISDGNPGIGHIGIRVRNRNSGETVLLPIFSLEKHLHLAVGGVRSSFRNLGLSEGEYGSRKGAAHSYCLGAADFASQYHGSEAKRFSDWPEAARSLLSPFRNGGKLSSLVKPSGKEAIVARENGHTSVYISASNVYGSPSGNGVQVQMYAIHCFGNSPETAVEAVPPFHSFSGYDTDFIHIHDYGELFPESKGWLPPFASGFARWTEL